MNFAIKALILFLFAALTAGFCAVSDRLFDRRKNPRDLPELDVEAMLDAIAQVESGNNPHAIGRFGERSAYQLMASTWRQYTTQPFALASSQPAFARAIAREHLVWLCTRLRALHPHLAPEFIAAAWQYGPAHAHFHTRTDAARRCANLYRDALAHPSHTGPR